MRYVNRFPELAAKLKPALQTGIKVVAFNVQAYARQGPYRTGFMDSNIYASGWWGSDYGGGESPPTDDVYLLPEVSPPDDMTAIVGAAANYSAFVNYGHHTRGGGFVPANPFFDQGVEQARGTFESDMATALAEGLQ